MPFVDFEQGPDYLFFITDEGRKVAAAIGSPEAEAGFKEVNAYLAGKDAKTEAEAPKEPALDAHLASGQETKTDEEVKTDEGAKTEGGTSEGQVTDASSETEDHTVTEEDLVANPQLTEQGVKVGDVIQVPKATETQV